MAESTINPVRAAPKGTTDDHAVARNAGRGALLLTLGKFYFLASSYVIYFAIGIIAKRHGVDLLGDFKSVGALLSVMNVIVVGSTVQSVSRFVGRNPDQARAIKRQSLLVQAGFGTAMAAAFWFLAPLAASGEGQEKVASGLRVAASIPLATALGAVLVGTLNGARRFMAQACLDIFNTTLRVLSIVVAIWLVPTAAAAYTGLFCATVVVALLAMVVTNRAQRGQSATHPGVPERATLFAVQLRTVGFLALVQWVVQMDIWYVQWWISSAEAVAASAKEIWAPINLFATIPYSIVTAIVLVMFPFVAAGASDREQSRVRTRGAVRYSLILLSGIVSVLIAAPETTLRFLPQGNFDLFLAAHPSAPTAFRLECVGFFSLCILYLLGSGANARGNPTRSIFIFAGVALLQAGLGWLLLPRMGLLGQGIATAVSISIGLLAAVISTGRELGSVFPVNTFLRTLVAGAVVITAITALAPQGKLVWMTACAAGFLLHVVILSVLREFTPEDRARFSALIRRKRGAP